MHLICSDGAGRVDIVQIYKSEHQISGGCDLVESLAHLWVFGHILFSLYWILFLPNIKQS